MKKYNYLGLCMAGGIGLSAVSGQAAPPDKKQPHIILIMTDQQRGDALRCAGNEAVIAPNIDRLAADGHLFCNAYTAAPSSTPARAGMLRLAMAAHLQEGGEKWMKDGKLVIRKQNLLYSSNYPTNKK